MAMGSGRGAYKCKSLNSMGDLRAVTPENF